MIVMTWNVILKFALYVEVILLLLILKYTGALSAMRHLFPRFVLNVIITVAT